MPGLVRAVALGAFIAAVAPVGTALASESSARAETLFAEAQACSERGDWACACEKFRESMTAEASASTQLNIAKCQMREGKPSEAWRTTQAALRLNAKAAYHEETRRRALAEYAAKLGAELEAATAALQLTFTERPPGLEVTLDGAVVPPAELETAMRLDPGKHVIVAQAAGYIPQRYFLIAVAGGHLEVPILLEAAPKSSGTDPAARPPTRAAEPDASDAGRPQLIAGWTVGAVGVAALGTSLAMGIITVLKSNSAEDTTACKAPDTNDRIRSCNELRDDARSFQTASVGLAVPGAVILGVGIALLATAPSTPEPAPKVSLTTRGFGLDLRVQF